MKTWGEIYHKWVRKGYDNGYAAWLADRYIQRKKQQQQQETSGKLETPCMQPYERNATL